MHSWFRYLLIGTIILLPVAYVHAMEGDGDGDFGGGPAGNPDNLGDRGYDRSIGDGGDPDIGRDSHLESPAGRTNDNVDASRGPSALGGGMGGPHVGSGMNGVRNETPRPTPPPSTPPVVSHVTPPVVVPPVSVGPPSTQNQQKHQDKESRERHWEKHHKDPEPHHKHQPSPHKKH